MSHADGFPRLPVVDAVSDRWKGRLLAPLRLERVAFVCVQHLLESTGSLLSALLALGAEPHAVFVMGKVYSTHASTAEALAKLGVSVVPSTQPHRPGAFSSTFEDDVAALWGAVLRADSKAPFEAVIVVDDGGYALRSVPPPLLNRRIVVGIEQTTSGLHQNIFGHFPIVQVASSAAKRWAEPPLIGEAVLTKLESLLPNFPKGTACGVVGLGPVGRAVATRLLQDGRPVVTFDSNGLPLSVAGARACSDPADLLAHADVIFGCTGRDISVGPWPTSLTGEKTLVSCSSGDVEFRRALRYSAIFAPKLPFSVRDTVAYEVPQTGLQVHILQGGFPINFDGSSSSVPAADIQLTRALLLGAIFQALAVAAQPSPSPTSVGLDAHLQRFVLQTWLEDQPHRRAEYSEVILHAFSQIDALLAGSNRLPSHPAHFAAALGLG